MCCEEAGMPPKDVPVLQALSQHKAAPTGNAHTRQNEKLHRVRAKKEPRHQGEECRDSRGERFTSGSQWPGSRCPAG
ncbi:hypothetical protein PPUJ13061_40810 [Pseudomonas putida]|nr:hypothetical protein PPUJ13061_40810 [Pseudomonas putida]